MAEMERLRGRNRTVHDELIGGPLAASARHTFAGATVEVVARAIVEAEDDFDELVEAQRQRPDHETFLAAAALAALSAHLTAPAQAGDTSGEEGL